MNVYRQTLMIALDTNRSYSAQATRTSSTDSVPRQAEAVRESDIQVTLHRDKFLSQNQLDAPISQIYFLE